jgi:hypothetical protein
MHVYSKDVFTGFGRFFRHTHIRRLVYLGLLALIALVEWGSAGQIRRTFVFYTIDSGNPVVEERMLLRAASKEVDIRRYVEETLLGPVSTDLAPLFSRDTGLRSLLYRDAVVYADLSEGAALPYDGGSVILSLETLQGGIRRNFSYVKDVRLFIDGHELEL